MLILSHVCGRERTTTEARGEELALAALTHVLEGRLGVEPVTSVHGAFYAEEQYDIIALELGHAALGLAASPAATREDAQKNSPELIDSRRVGNDATSLAEHLRQQAEEMEKNRIEMEKQRAEIDALRRQAAAAAEAAAAAQKSVSRVAQAIDLQDKANDERSSGGVQHQQLQVQAANSQSGGSAQADVRVKHVEIQQNALSEDVSVLRQQALLAREEHAKLETAMQSMNKGKSSK